MESKPWYLSKTVWGAIAGVVGVVFPKVISALGGTDAAADQVVTIVGAAVTVVGSLVAIYGRIKATTTLTATAK
jgi:ABC-type Fe2+-enterobactin transport system substrate-binding protein